MLPAPDLLIWFYSNCTNVKSSVQAGSFGWSCLLSANVNQGFACWRHTTVTPHDNNQRTPLRHKEREGGQFITLNAQGRDGTWQQERRVTKVGGYHATLYLQLVCTRYSECVSFAMLYVNLEAAFREGHLPFLFTSSCGRLLCGLWDGWMEHKNGLSCYTVL